MNGKPSLHYAEVTAQAGPGLAAAWLERLPAARRARIERLREPLDRAATLAGVALLNLAFRALGRAFEPAALVFPERGRPHVPGGPEFSIAHAPGARESALVGCVLAVGMRIGLDLEPRRAARAAQLRLVLLPEEAAAVAEGRLDATDAWVMKEAVLKASGRGAAAARSVELCGPRARHEGTTWHLRRVDVGAGHVAWVATERELGPAPLAVRAHRADDLHALPA